MYLSATQTKKLKVVFSCKGRLKIETLACEGWLRKF